MTSSRSFLLLAAAIVLLSSGPRRSFAAEGPVVGKDRPAAVGFAVRAGGRYDDVRMCVATPSGVKGGPAADVALFAELPVGEKTSVRVDLPVMRPVLFAAAFRMLQLEPQVALLFHGGGGGRVGLVAGPTLGVSLHYGPDYRSAVSGDGRGPSFFALGPQLGAYLGLDFARPGKRFDFQLGASPYAALLFGVDDPAGHRGVVAGGTLDALFRFSL